MLALFVLTSSVMVFQACSKHDDDDDDDDDDENEVMISKAGDDDSHNNGQNCMNCHKPGGSGEGHFTVAGSMYRITTGQPSANDTLRLSTEPGEQGTIVKTIIADAKGNFYTTEAVDFSQGLYPTVTSSVTGDKYYMLSNPPSGQCNSCHGVTSDPIWGGN